MRNVMTMIQAGIAAVAVSAHLLAGGFWLLSGNPEASGEARAMKAVLTVKAAGCHDPAKATATGTAIGILGGEKREIALKLVPLSEAGMWSLTQQWPAEGNWVLVLTAKVDGMVTSTLVPAGPAGVNRTAAKMAMRQANPQEVEALLKGAPAVAMK
jgi:hypothetical protein